MPTALTDADKVLRNDTGKDIVSELQNLVAAVKPDAEDIPYDNTTSGLTADDVQNAIDEVQGNVNSLDASSIPYDNTSSGLTADDVQEAIDEVQGNVDTLSTDLTPTAGTLSGQHANFSGGGYSLTRSGKIVVFSFYRGITGDIAGNVELATLPSGFIPYADTRLYANGVYNGNPLASSVTASSDGKIYASFGSNNLTSALTISGVYICQ